VENFSVNIHPIVMAGLDPAIRAFAMDARAIPDRIGDRRPRMTRCGGGLARDTNRPESLGRAGESGLSSPPQFRPLKQGPSHCGGFSALSGCFRF
jgi:hypothetical protein